MLSSIISKLSKHIFYLSSLLVALLVVIIFLWGLTLPTDVTTHHAPAITVINEGWTQIVAEQPVPLLSVGCYVPTDIHVPIVLERVVDADLAGNSLAFYAEHQTVFLSVGDRILYQFTTPQYMEFFGSAGRTWINVHIPYELEGQTLRLTLNSNFALYQGVPARFYSVPDGNLFLAQLNFLWLRNTVALILLGLAIISYVNMHLWKQKQMRQFLFSLANLYLFVALWICAEINILAVWLQRAPLSAVMAMIFLRIIPISIYHFFRSMVVNISWRSKLAGLLVWGNLLSAVILQFVFQVSLIDTLNYNVIVVVAAAILGFGELFHSLYHNHFSTSQGRIFRSTALILVASLVECHIYLHYQRFGHWMGVPLAVACIVHAIICHIHMVHSESKTAIEKKRLEEERQTLIRRPLHQQINAHFLYNTLNTISALCKVDPLRADVAVKKMAQYMRSYTNLVGANDYVPLEEELDLMQSYMDIQNMRFNNNIHFTIQNHCDDVLLPPLALQPLVENAVNHGIQNRHHCGTISILAQPKNSMAEIIVSDDGIGFDTTKSPCSKRVGLHNLNQRITAMGGTMTVQSQPGLGTTITLLVPLLYDDQEIQ